MKALYAGLFLLMQRTKKDLQLSGANGIGIIFSDFAVEILNISEKGKNLPPVGLEPTTFELEVQHASPLRHGGFMSRKHDIFCNLFHYK